MKTFEDDIHRVWQMELGSLPVSVKAWRPEQYTRCLDIELEVGPLQVALSLDLEQAQQLRNVLDLAVTFSSAAGGDA